MSDEQTPAVVESPQKRGARGRRPALGKTQHEIDQVRQQNELLQQQVSELRQLAMAGGGGMTPELFLKAMEKQAEILRSNKDVDEELSARIHAQAMKKALRPENEIAPGISAFNPKGERDHARPKPTHIYMMARYPICDPGNYDTTTWSELELLNQLKAGAYKVTKADGTDVEVLVKTEYDSAGRPYRTTLFADGKGIADDEQKHNWPPLMQILTQMITGEAPMQSFARYQRVIDEQAARIRELEASAAKAASRT